MIESVNWAEIRAFLAVVVVVFAAAGWVHGLWLKTKLSAFRQQIADDLNGTYMPAETLELRFKAVHRRIERLESPPVADKLEALRLSVAHLSKQMDEKNA